MSRVVLLPTSAVARVCHDEQMRVWAHEMVVSLGMADLLKLTSYEESLEVERIVRDELQRILESAFNHPEALTMARQK